MVEYIGGQALIEGVLMKNGNLVAVAVRNPEGKIEIHKKEYKFFNTQIPILRGIINLFTIMYIGIKSLNLSASIALKEENDKKESWIGLTFSFLFAILFAIALFKFLPLGVAQLIDKNFGVNNYLFNLIDGFVKILVFVLYVFVISKFADIRRVFQYHGAEHKAVHCHEHKLGLTVKNVQKFPTEHRRCGTTFIFLVLILSIFVYTFIPKTTPFVWKLILRLLLLPVIAGISYEVLRFGAKYENNFLVNLLIKPGLWIQEITTQEPDDKQVEVAIKSLKAVL